MTHGVSPTTSGAPSSHQAPVTLDQSSTAEDVDEAAIIAAVSEKTAIDNAAATTIAVGGATVSPTADTCSTING